MYRLHIRFSSFFRALLFPPVFLLCPLIYLLLPPILLLRPPKARIFKSQNFLQTAAAAAAPVAASVVSCFALPPLPPVSVSMCASKRFSSPEAHHQLTLIGQESGEFVALTAIVIVTAPA